MVDRTNAEWLHDLNAEGPEKEAALEDLRAAILKSLPYALSNYLSPANPLFNPLTEEVAQETLLRTLEHLESFEGRSQLTTWVQKIAMRIALTELRRRRWRDFSLDSMVDENEEGLSFPSLLIDTSPDPDTRTEQLDVLQRVGRLIDEELTDKQRQAMVAVTIRGVPMDEVARRMDMKRNALYKLLHDARLRLKRRLATEGLTPEDIWRAFEEG